MILKKVLIILLLAYFIFLFFSTSITIKPEKNIIPNLEEILLSIKKYTNSNSVISFKSNNSYEEFYYCTQFVMVPLIIENNINNDTILYIIDKGMNNADSLKININYQVIKNVSTDKYKVFLLKKNK
ncbi:MAG: hypothetical protein NTZ33_13245 [Bacteroidetes bacterium]|nr:hypothetical protein [Bacteroidota bacterium]